MFAPSLWICIVWIIWKGRNKLILYGKWFKLDKALEEVKSRFWNWCSVKYPSFFIFFLFSNWLENPRKYATDSCKNVYHCIGYSCPYSCMNKWTFTLKKLTCNAKFMNFIYQLLIIWFFTDEVNKNEFKITIIFFQKKKISTIYI